MISFSRNNRGFTLIEILIVAFLLVSLGTVAINSYVNADKSYQFISNYKNALSTLRTGRLYAFTNHEIKGLDFDHYGVYINEYCIVLFADSVSSKFKFNPDPSEELGGNCVEIAEGSPAIPDPEIFPIFNIVNYEILNEYNALPPQYDYIIQTKKFIFDKMNYKFNIDGSTMPMAIFYELSSGKVEIYDNNGTAISPDVKSLEITLSDETNNLSKSISFFKYSGLSEESN